MRNKNLLTITWLCLCSIIITSCNTNKIDREKLSKIILEYELKNYSEGILVVSKNGKYGFISKGGREIVPCIYDYDRIDLFSDGFAIVQKE